jgi:hypothetical protein
VRETIQTFSITGTKIEEGKKIDTIFIQKFISFILILFTLCRLLPASISKAEVQMKLFGKRHMQRLSLSFVKKFSFAENFQETTETFFKIHSME